MTGHPSDLPIIIRYVPQSRVADYEAAGWIRNDGFTGTHHGEYFVMMEWLLDKGDPVEPEKECHT